MTAHANMGGRILERRLLYQSPKLRLQLAARVNPETKKNSELPMAAPVASEVYGSYSGPMCEFVISMAAMAFSALMPGALRVSI